LTQVFFKRYINHVKQTVVPELTDDAILLCAALWTLLRDKDANDRDSQNIKVLPVTIRTQ
jgi:DNA replicative helicase MCM subunit Mcm2 (Cdc46/Mcm family)